MASPPTVSDGWKHKSTHEPMPRQFGIGALSITVMAGKMAYGLIHYPLFHIEIIGDQVASKPSILTTVSLMVCMSITRRFTGYEPAKVSSQ